MGQVQTDAASTDNTRIFSANRKLRVVCLESVMLCGCETWQWKRKTEKYGHAEMRKVGWVGGVKLQERKSCARLIGC